MARAEICIPRILEHEGGFVNHPRDPGGATNKGVTLNTFRAYVKPDGTVDDLRNITTAQAVTVYKRHYWDKVRADELPPGVDYAVADFAVNSGPSRAAKYLQAVVGVTQDGVVGPQTIAAANALDPGVVINELCDRRMKFLRGLSTWPDFGRGWSSRVEGVRATALADTAHETEPSPVPHIEPTDRKEESVPVAAYAVGLAALAVIAFMIFAA